MEKKGEVVCVTGGSGFIGSWLVRLLLDRGYTVHATVKDLEDEKETKHLQALDGAELHLHLFQIDLLDYDSIFAAVTGTTGVFHLASPCIVDQVHDPEKQLLAPAIKGTNNVLTAAKELGVQRVVVTSSIGAITPSRNWPADVVKNEDCWTDVEYCKQNGLWYTVSKTLAEKAAWEFAKEKGLDVVVVNPGIVLGPILPPTINASMLALLRLLQGNFYTYLELKEGDLGKTFTKVVLKLALALSVLGVGCTDTYEDAFMGSVHVKDVALAHILVYENKLATGRHLCVEAISHYGDFAAKVAELYPEHKVPRLPKDTQPGLLRSKNGAKKLMELGLEFIPVEQIIRESSLISTCPTLLELIKKDYNNHQIRKTSTRKLNTFERAPSYAVKTDKINIIASHDDGSILICQSDHPRAADKLLGYASTRTSFSKKGIIKQCLDWAGTDLLPTNSEEGHASTSAQSESIGAKLTVNWSGCRLTNSTPSFQRRGPKLKGVGHQDSRKRRACKQKASSYFVFKEGSIEKNAWATAENNATNAEQKLKELNDSLPGLKDEWTNAGIDSCVDEVLKVLVKEFQDGYNYALN
ncbi:hypothetical protein LguiA_011937 [Lonicera macranthoides]